jgi:trk system potassium uptake protein TrkA
MLAEAGADVIAVDNDKSLVEAVSDSVHVAVALDSTDEEALRAQGIDKVDVAIVGIGGAFESAVLTTVVLKQIGVPRVIARATSNTRAQILSRIGADDIVNPEKESAERWRNRLLAPTILERSALAEGYALAQIAAPESFFAKTLRELDVANRFRVLVVAIRRELPAAEGAAATQTVLSVPGPQDAIKQGDVLVVIGPDDAVDALPKA